MQAASLNKLAWQKLKQNNLAFFALVFIMISVLFALFAVVISPDKTPKANEMHIELSALEPDRGIPVPEEGFDPSPVPSTTTTTTMPEDNDTMDIESRSAGITNMYGRPPQDVKTKMPMSERKQKINNVFTKLFTSMIGNE